MGKVTSRRLILFITKIIVILVGFPDKCSRIPQAAEFPVTSKSVQSALQCPVFILGVGDRRCWCRCWCIVSFRWFSEKLLLDLQDNLLGVAKLQATQIDQWLLERKGDARVLASRPTTINALKAFATNEPNSAIVQQQQANLTQLALDVQTSYDYRRIVFFNRQGQTVWQTGVQNPLPQEINTVFREADHQTSLGEKCA